MICSRCECSFYLARSFLSYSNSLLTGCLIGLVVASVVTRYQSYLLQMENQNIQAEIDLYTTMSKGCQEELKKFHKNKENSEEIKQLNRMKEGLLLDKDILKQLKVNLEAKIKLKANG